MATAAAAYTFTHTFHKKPYPSISPLRPELSQNGKTVLVTAGHTGIGYSAARAFGQASAARIIIVGRRAPIVEESVAKLKEELKTVNPAVIVEGRHTDITDQAALNSLWLGLKDAGIYVDVLVLSAATATDPEPILDAGTSQVWAAFLINTRSTLELTERFYKQDVGKDKAGVPKYLVNLSSSAVHHWLAHAPERPTYGLTKNAGTLILQQIAKDTPVEKLQIVNFHPGGILTELARNAGYSEGDFEWDDENLPGQFAVWAASPEASFLHGRFIWANWDVDELKSGELRKKIEEDPLFLKIGVRGL